MRKLFIVVALAIASSAFGKVTDEGMWLPLLLKKYNYEQMKQMGLKLSAEDIYSPDKPSLNDAIMSFGGFCTGEIVSKEGLVLTNHHCGFDAVQSHSTVEHDYLTNGFWAMNRKEELSNEGLYVNILRRMEDVTAQVIAASTDFEGKAKDSAMDAVITELTEKAVEGTGYHATVESMFNGLEYYLFVYEKYTDIRLVGAPPSSIGKYGGDTDNWMWPRQTGDFSVFRIYAGKDNKPADYSPENVPYKPVHHLPISLKGVQPKDFSMTYGYPGNTDRFITSYGIQLAVENLNQTLIDILGKRLEVMKADMNADDAVRIELASKYASLSNGYKYYIGQTAGLKRLNVYDYKKKEEAAFRQWANSTPENKEKYGKVLDDIGQAYGNLTGVVVDLYYTYQTMTATKARSVLNTTYPLISVLSNDEATDEDINKQVESIKGKLDGLFTDYNAPTDAKIFGELLTMYADKVSESKRSEMVAKLASKNKGDLREYGREEYMGSIFGTRENFEAFLAKPSLKKIQKDPFYKIYMSLAQQFEPIRQTYIHGIVQIEDRTATLIEGMRKMDPNRTFYPDANSTLRLSYGKVTPYEPRDGVSYKYYTTLAGVMEKKDNTNDEFVVPDKLVELYNNKDYGRYGVNGTMPVNFITDNDITGGNSGSPVINGEGQLIGIAFDGNWEAMTGDLVYDAQLKRCINVDIRYVLFIIDKFAGAGHLIEEMTIIE